MNLRMYIFVVFSMMHFFPKCHRTKFLISSPSSQFISEVKDRGLTHGPFMSLTRVEMKPRLATARPLLSSTSQNYQLC